MYSGISGLRNFQTKLDVIGNNIANVNTHGFKKGRVVFKDLISQTSSGASAPGMSTGGVNAKQIGLGSTLAAIDTIHGTGSLQTTNRTLDVAMEGEGFFVVGNLETPDPNDPQVVPGFGVSYTRAGNFYLDSEGFLVNSNGDYVIGWAHAEMQVGDPNDPNANPDAAIQHQPQIDDTGAEVSFDQFKFPNNTAAGAGGAGLGVDVELQAVGQGGRIYIPNDAQEMAIGTDGTVTYTDSNGVLNYAGQLMIAKFPNAEGLTKVGGNYYASSANSGAVGFAVGGELGIGKTVSGALEMSNVDLSEEFTEMIVAQRGFQANTRIITTSDEILQELVNLKR